MNVPVFFVVLTCGLLIVGVLVVLFLPAQRPQQNTDTSADRYVSNNVFRDDRYWYGFIYNNPDDPNMFVPKRYGLGWTVNFGHPWGKLFLFGTLAIPLALAILGLLFPGIFPANGCHTFGCHP